MDNKLLRNLNELERVPRRILCTELWSVAFSNLFHRLTPNDPYMGRTTPLTSKSCILYIYSTNTGNEYFKHVLYSPFFPFKMQFVS